MPPIASYGCEVCGSYTCNADARAQRAALAQQHWQILRKILGVHMCALHMVNCAAVHTHILWQEVPVNCHDDI